MNQQISKQQTPHSSLLVNAALRIFRGFARLFVGRLHFDVMVELLTRAVMEEGCRRVARENDGKIIKSRVVLLTGVRTEHISKTPPPVEYDEASLTVEARILANWANKPEYRDAETGKPKDLLIYGAGQTFQRLITSVTGRGVTAQSVLSRLCEAGNVEIIDEYWLRLINPYWKFVLPVESEMLDIGTFNVSNLLQTIDWNLAHRNDTDQKRFERGVWSISLPDQQIPALRQALKATLDKAYAETATVIRQFESQDCHGMDDKTRTIIGVNYFCWERGRWDSDCTERGHTDDDTITRK